MDISDDPNRPRPVDNALSPELFADSALSFSVVNGVVRIAFTSLRWAQADLGAIPTQQVVARLCMPVSGAQELAVGLNAFLESRGLSPTKAAVGDATPQ